MENFSKLEAMLDLFIVHGRLNEANKKSIMILAKDVLASNSRRLRKEIEGLKKPEVPFYNSALDDVIYILNKLS